MAASNLSPEQEAKITGHVQTFVTDVESATTRLRRIWLRLYKNYRIFQAEGKQSWQSRLWIPKTFAVIEQIASRTTAHNPKFNLRALQSSALQFFTTNQNKIDEAIATNKEADEEGATSVPVAIPEAEVISSRDVLDAWLSWVFMTKKLKKKIRLWDKGRLIYGTYHVKIDVEILTEAKIKKAKDDNGDEIEIREEIFKNVLPNVETIDIFDFLIHPLETDVDTAYAVGHKRENCSINEFDPDVYFNLDKIDPSQSKGVVFSEELEKDQVVATDAQKKINKNSFTTIEVWGRFSLSGDPEDEKDYIMTVAEESILIRFEENPYKDADGTPIRPFVAMHDQPVPGEYYAIGEAEPIMSLQEEMNDLRNLRQDFNNSVLYPEWLVRKGSGINPYQLVHKPNNIILADNINDIKALPKETVPQSSYNEEQAINRDIQDTTATTSFAQPGATSAFTDTVTGASIRQQEQNTRMKLKIEYLDDAVSELGRKMLLIVRESVEDSIEFPNGDDFIKVFKDNFKEMAESFSPVVVSGSMASETPGELRNEAIARGNISLQYAQSGVPINLQEEYKNIMENGFAVKDFESLIKEPEPQLAPEGAAPQPGAAPAPQPQNNQLL